MGSWVRIPPGSPIKSRISSNPSFPGNRPGKDWGSSGGVEDGALPHSPTTRFRRSSPAMLVGASFTGSAKGACYRQARTPANKTSEACRLRRRPPFAASIGVGNFQALEQRPPGRKLDASQASCRRRLKLLAKHDKLCVDVLVFRRRGSAGDKAAHVARRQPIKRLPVSYSQSSIVLKCSHSPSFSSKFSSNRRTLSTN
jgi:hypothetical protein